jgi:hypothetical protein
MTVATVNNTPAANDDDTIEGTVVVESTLYSDMLNVTAYKTTEQLKEMSDDQRAAWYKNVAERTSRASKKAGSAIEELAVMVAIAYAGDVPGGLGITWADYVAQFAPLISSGDIVIGRKFTSAFYVALHRIASDDKKVPGARKVHAAIGDAIGCTVTTFSNGLKDAREKDLPASNAAIARKAVADAQKAKEIEAKKEADKAAKEEKAKADALAAKLDKAKATNAEVNGTPAGESPDDESDDEYEMPADVQDIVTGMAGRLMADAAEQHANNPLENADAPTEPSPTTVTTDAGEFVAVQFRAADMKRIEAILRANGVEFTALVTATA